MTATILYGPDDFGGGSATGGSFGFGDAIKLGSAGLALGGGITSALGATQSAAGQAASYKAQAAAYRNDALEQGYQAAQNWYAFGRKAQLATYQQNRLLGQQRALYSAAGVSPGSGTPLDVMSDTESQFSFDAFDRYLSALAYGQKAGRQSVFDLQAAAAEEEAAKEAKDAGKTSATSSILGGIGSALGIVGKVFDFF